MDNSTPIRSGVNKPVFTIQIIRYYCTSCGEEKEEVKLCSACGSSMRVVEVIEKYGDEAKEYLSKFITKRNIKLEGVAEDAQVDTQNADFDSELDIAEKDADSFYSDSIFPDTDSDSARQVKIKNGNGSSIEEVLNILNENEEKGDDDDDEFADLMFDDGDGDNGLPVL